MTDLQIALLSAGAGLVGSIIGVAGSWLSIWLQKMVNASGRISVHTRIVYSKWNKKTWGVERNDEGRLFFHIPIWVDICNTSNMPQIVRDLNVYGYKNHREVAIFTQAQGSGKEENYFVYANNGAYTFVIPPNSACRFNLEFSLKQSEVESEDRDFDELILAYYDNKNRFKRFKFIEIQDAWAIGERPRVKQWKTMDCEVKYRGN